AGTGPFVFAGIHWFGSSGALHGRFAGNALIALISITTASLPAKRFFTSRAPLTSNGAQCNKPI
ncbi:hypothetical protein RA278_29790, partial [Pseudomonas syringae pv. tagetis]